MDRHEQCQGCKVTKICLKSIITFTYDGEDYNCPCGTCLVKMTCNKYNTCEEFKWFVRIQSLKLWELAKL